ncbi:MAG: hypothetical protein WC455_25905 [Dehalococcoidia bacterium]
MGRNKMDGKQIRKMYWAPRLTLEEREKILAACSKISSRTGYEVTPSELIRKGGLREADRELHKAALDAAQGQK